MLVRSLHFTYTAYASVGISIGRCTLQNEYEALVSGLKTTLRLEKREQMRSEAWLPADPCPSSFSGEGTGVLLKRLDEEGGGDLGLGCPPRLVLS